MRTPLIAGNWKMFKTVHETVTHVQELARALAQTSAVQGGANSPVDVIVAPPLTALKAAADAARESRIEVAAQNVHWEREGAFTGEVSAAMIRDAGARHVIIGHSERRTLFGETNLTVNKKIAAALVAGLRPIVCIGETLQQREANQTLAVLDEQLREGLDGLTAERLRPMVLAYEPVWAIGTGRNATPEQAQDAHAHVRGRLRQWFGAEFAEQCRVLYGGSVKPENTRALMGQADVDGALVGGASLEVGSFMAIVTAAMPGA